MWSELSVERPIRSSMPTSVDINIQNHSHSQTSQSCDSGYRSLDEKVRGMASGIQLEDRDVQRTIKEEDGTNSLSRHIQPESALDRLLKDINYRNPMYNYYTSSMKVHDISKTNSPAVHRTLVTIGEDTGRNGNVAQYGLCSQSRGGPFVPKKENVVLTNSISTESATPAQKYDSRWWTESKLTYEAKDSTPLTRRETSSPSIAGCSKNFFSIQGPVEPSSAVNLSPHKYLASGATGTNLNGYGPVGSTMASVRNHAQQVAATVRQLQHRIVERYGPKALTCFRPSNSALRSHLKENQSLVERLIPTALSGGTNNYLGDLTIDRNHSANITDDQNCALWLLGLPANVTHKDLLEAIRGVGKVYAAVINGPTGIHLTSAAKVVFFKRSHAENLLLQSKKGIFHVNGRPISKVRWNNIKSAEYTHNEHSRAIRITGATELMDFDYFEEFFKARFTFELDCRGIVPCSTPGMLSHEWHFGSLRCQAASAKTAIERELKGIYIVEWAADPCEGLSKFVANMQYV